MSRAFITDKEDWVYCPKAGERCMHAEEGKDCTETGCKYYERKLRQINQTSASLKIVRKKTKTAATAGKPKTAETGPKRKTKKSNLPKPKKWGGRSAFHTIP